MLKEHLQAQVLEFAARHGLHSEHDYKANLETLKSVFDFQRLPATAAICSVTQQLEPFPGKPAPTPRIFVRDHMTYEDRRLAIAHEVGHIILGHNDSHGLYKVAPYFHNAQEREAWQAAALLLISWRAVLDSPHVRWLQRVCVVPAWLINELPYVQRAFSLPLQKRPAMFS
jgi:hypothetical protein